MIAVTNRLASLDERGGDGRWSVSLAAWGAPSDPRTFSGYSRALADELRRQGRLDHEYSLKMLRLSDVLSGAVMPRLRDRRLRLGLSGKWAWSLRAHEALSRRAAGLIQRHHHSGAILQIGTLVFISGQFGPQYALTDMTIPQARRAGEFGFERFSRHALQQAVEIQGRVIAQARHIFTLTEWARDSVIQDFGISPQRVTAVYIGPVVHFGGGMIARRRPSRVLFVGRDWQRKGGPALVEGFRLLRRRMPSAELVIVGCRPAVREPGVQVVGYLDPRNDRNREVLRRHFLESSCLALMSDFEPLGNVIIEGFASGLPVVACDVGSRREIVRDGVDGILCHDRSPAAIADALESLLADPRRLETMRASALWSASHRFTWSRVVADIGAVIAGAHESEVQPRRNEACGGATCVLDASPIGAGPVASLGGGHIPARGCG